MKKSALKLISGMLMLGSWLTLNIVIPAHADDADFLVAPSSSLDMSRLQLEDWLRARMTAALTPFVPQSQFFVTVKVTLKDDHAHAKSIELPNIDTVVPMFSTGDAGSRSKLIVKLVSNVSIMVALDRRVPEETIAGVTDIAHNLVPLVPASSIKVSMIRMARPGWSVQDWFLETKDVFTILLSALILGGSLVLFGKSRFPIVRETFRRAQATSETSEEPWQESRKKETVREASAAPFSPQFRPSREAEASEVVEYESIKTDSNIKASVRRFEVRKEFPEEIILSIPTVIGRLAFRSLSPRDKVGLLVVLSPQARDKFLSRMAPDSTKMGVFLDIELKQSLSDPERVRECDHSRDELANVFRLACLEVVQDQATLRAELNSALEEWIFTNPMKDVRYESEVA